ncbi:MAG: hypothetical protein WDM80_07300 [Limisphaerales bacterium]
MNVNYRIASIADFRALCALRNEVSLFHHNALCDFFALPKESQRDEELWRKAIEGGQSVAFVTERATTVIGFVTGEIEDEKVTLFKSVRFWVNPADWRSQFALA